MMRMMIMGRKSMLMTVIMMIMMVEVKEMKWILIIITPTDHHSFVLWYKFLSIVTVHLTNYSYQCLA